MTSMELNLEIKRCLEAFGDDETALKKVADYMKKLLSKRNESLVVTPELQTIIDSADDDMAAGRTVTCHNSEELNAFLDSL